LNAIKKILRLSAAYVKYFYAFTKTGGEWGGYIRGDNSLCFANYVAERDPSLNLYWIARKDDNLNLNLLDSRIKVLEYGSEEAESILKTAGAMFTTGSFYDLSSSPYNFYGKAISVNLHHCAPFKRGGYRESNVQKRGFIYRSFIYKFYCKLFQEIQFFIQKKTYKKLNASL